VIGNRTRVKVVKNKMAPPFKEVEFDILYGEGISKEGDLLDLAANMNVIEKSGTWYTYKDERIGQGRENSRNYLKERPEMIKTIRKEIMVKAGLVKTNEAKASAPVVTSNTTSTAPTQSKSSAATTAMASASKAAASVSKAKQ
jgi:recombination protein RecA